MTIDRAASALSWTFDLILEAQQAQEPIAWIAACDSFFYPPDVAANGVDVATIAVVRLSNGRDAARCSEKLIASGGFGLVVVDLGNQFWLKPALQSRLSHACREQSATVLLLGELSGDSGTNGLRSDIRATATRTIDGGDIVSHLNIKKDTRGCPWHLKEHRLGTPGMR